MRSLLYRSFYLQPLSRACRKASRQTPRCVQLSQNNLCAIFGSPLRPKVCASLKPEAEMCATNREDAMTWLLHLELSTS
ncbi:proteinase inhibitor [Klebsiella michiganensis]|nr:proteinase inhibitor [Klebsiella michiganensis]